MKAVQCWEGSNGTLHRSEWDAAADILGRADSGQIKRVTDVPIPDASEKVKAAILWIADEIRKPKTKPKKAKRR